MQYRFILDISGMVYNVRNLRIRGISPPPGRRGGFLILMGKKERLGHIF